MVKKNKYDKREIDISSLQVNITKHQIDNVKFIQQEYSITTIVRYLIIFETYLLFSISKLIIVCQLARQSG